MLVKRLVKTSVAFLFLAATARRVEAAATNASRMMVKTIVALGPSSYIETKFVILKASMRRMK